MHSEKRPSSSEFPSDFEPSDQEFLDDLDDAFLNGQFAEKNDGLLDFQQPEYNPDLELTVRFISKYPRMLARINTYLDGVYFKLLKKLGAPKDVRRYFALESMKKEDEEIKRISELEPEEKFIHIEKMPREGNEYVHCLKAKCKAKSGKRTVSFGVTYSGTTFLVTQFVLVKKK